MVSVRKFLAGGLFFHFHNDSAKVECMYTSTSPDPVSKAVLLKLKRDGRRGVGGEEIKTGAG